MASSSSSSPMRNSSSPCAACKFLRRKCTPQCIFAPYFPPDYPQRFENVHKVYGASNVTKLLNDMDPSQREDAVNSLVIQAEARIKDPVYGCVGECANLAAQIKKIQEQIAVAKFELAYLTSMKDPGLHQQSFLIQGDRRLEETTTIDMSPLEASTYMQQHQWQLMSQREWPVGRHDPSEEEMIEKIQRTIMLSREQLPEQFTRENSLLSLAATDSFDASHHNLRSSGDGPTNVSNVEDGDTSNCTFSP
ncbi:hypothetical protein KP509_01G082600 [Ceratopteris richardii]|uniref:LOB domain-containing protein n=1 Tax=Ceratopteris richardii TaxID=49495 RepID=A0A8T2VHY7_CERRI|nr:hypothetical protein KP509_01G082600 [Ceratopteris richardii]KAH7446935.1 hypothetical protein KP509_01G082600 [Ceratopteris richardii]KAH7446936.1 hypothetical protein KP509_01G082600 [Ceratopteris richardii]